MKKTVLLGTLLFVLSSSLLYAAEDGRTTHGPLVRPFMVIGRGVMNIVGLPMEIPLTIAREADMHRWVWPVTFVPRLVTNIVIRITSAVNDILIFPWVTPFTNDLSPWTRPMGLSEYPWQFE